MRQFNGMDSLFLYMDSARTPMHGAFLQIYAPVPGERAAQRFARLRRHIASRLDTSPVFRRAILRSPLELDHAWWIDGVDIDLDYHVRHSALPEPGSLDQLHEAYARLYAQGMDLERPLWEIHVIDGVNGIPGVPRGSFALVVKFHHAGADGVSATEITSALHSTTPDRDEHPQALRDGTTLPPPPTLPDALRRGARQTAQFGQTLGRELAARAPTLARQFAAQLRKRMAPTVAAASGGARNAPRTPLNVAISPGRTYAHTSLDLAQIALIRKQVPGATVNDVFLAVCGGALRQFLLAQDALPSASLIGGVPVNVRVESERGQAGNQFTLMLARLGTNQADPLLRLQAIAEQSAQLKASMNQRSGKHSGARKSAGWFKILPASLLSVAFTAMRSTRLTAKMKPVINLVVTNVPGPAQTLYLDGARLLDISGVPPVMDGLGMVIAASSYEGALKVGIGGCRRVMPKPEAMRAHLDAAFDELLQATGVVAASEASAGKPAPGRSPRRRRSASVA